ncbi:hypothetical protein TNCV_1615311 [Trichonephila clavipes]|nr:hypothetical protein TNCV_1615311 [Trichonephila clavipes]
MTQRTAPWENWHLERGFELLRTFGLVRWGLGGGGHVEGTGEKLSFASQAARYTSNSTSSSTTQANLLPSASSIKPTTKIASRLPKPISSAVAPDNNLITSASSLSAETRTLIRSNKAAALSTELQPLPESDPTASNDEHSTAAEAQQIVKRKSRNRRKRPKIQNPDIDIQRVPHKSRHATPTEITTDEEDLITYDVEEEELEQDPFILPKGYLRALTPSRYRNYRD